MAHGFVGAFLTIEGPTDRMFLNKCLGILRPDLVEGLHYQVVYYGGKLLAGLTSRRVPSPPLNARASPGYITSV